MTIDQSTPRRVPPAWATCPHCRSEGVILGPGPRRECVTCGHVWTDRPEPPAAPEPDTEAAP